MMELINLNTYIEIINQKIKDKNYNFNKFEIQLIINNSKLLNNFLNGLSEDYKVWFTISREVHNYFMIEYSIEFPQKLKTNYLLYLIDKGEINGVLESTFINNQNEDIIKQHLKNRLLDSHYNPNVTAPSKDLLKMIVDLNRMDLLSKISTLNYIEPELIDKIKKYYILNNIVVPDAILNCIKELAPTIENMSLEKYIEYLENGNEKLNITEYEHLVNKIKSTEIKRSKAYDWNKIFSRLTDDKIEEIVSILIEKKYYQIVKDIEKLSLINEKNLIKNYIETAGKDPDFLEDVLPTSNKYFIELLENDEIISNLIENNKFVLVSYSPKFSEYKDAVINKIISSKVNYKKTNVKKFKDLNLYPDIIYALFISGNEMLNEFIKENENLKSLVKKAILSGKSNNVPAVLAKDNGFIEKLILSGQAHLLIETQITQNRNNNLILTNETENILIEQLAKNPVLSMKFLYYYSAAILNNKLLLKFFLSTNNLAREFIINKLNHLEEEKAIYTEEMFALVKPFLQEKYDLNLAHLEEVEKRFGPQIIRYIDNENIKKIINLEPNKFLKFLQLFPTETFTMTDVEKIYDSLKQYAFSNIYNEDVEIFSRIIHSISDNNLNYINDINKIIEMLSTKEELEKLYKKFNINYSSLSKDLVNSPSDFMDFIASKIHSGTSEEKIYYQNVLHFITDHYIAYKREEYRKKYQMINELSIPYYLDYKDTIKQYIKLSAVKTYRNLIVLEMADLGIDKTLANDCIDYYADNKRDFSNDRINEIQNHLRLLIEITTKIITKMGVYPSIVDTLDADEKIRRKYFVNSNNNIIYSILSEINIDLIKETILKPENSHIYESLIFYMKKYKLHLIPDYFKSLMASEQININLETGDIANFITYFQQIYEDEMKRISTQGKGHEDLNLNFISILKYAETYSSVSSVYSQVLGQEDFRLIKHNPGPNSATRKTSNNERLKEAVIWTLNNYKRTEVTIPTFNEVLYNNNKSMRAIVGNFNHPSNITMGERTGSCMRIGGAGDTLFDFVLSDKNGFHIRFEDSYTEEFISRVSGFRNGNTVFLNELRCSCNPEKYSNQDIVNFCTIVANMLIEKSKDSSCPIENVVLHNDYATKNLGLKEEILNINDNKQGLRNFYCDVKDKVIILATTEEPFKEVNFDKTYVESYMPAREMVYKSGDSKKLRMLINRIHAVKYALSGIGYEYIAPFEFKNEIQYGIANQDFYVFIDSEGEIFEESINTDERLFGELEEARKEINKIKEQNFSTQR